MPFTRKNATRPALGHLPRERVTPFGGLMLVEALCRRWDLWRQIDGSKFPITNCPDLGTQPAKTLIAQLLLSAAAGGTTLAEAAMLKDEPLLRQIVGLKWAAAESVLRSWLSIQNEAAYEELTRLNAMLVRSMLAQFFPPTVGDANTRLSVVMHTKKWKLSKGLRHTIAENTQVEVDLGWRTLAVGPFILDGAWSANPNAGNDVAQFEFLLGKHSEVWRRYETYFRGEWAPDGAAWKRGMEMAGFTDWTAELDVTTASDWGQIEKQTKELQWEEARSENAFAQLYSFAHPPLSKAVPGVVAIARRNTDENLYWWRYLLVPPRSQRSAEAFFTLHGKTPLTLLTLLDSLNLDPLLQLETHARNACFAIMTIAFNLLTVLRLLTPQQPNWTVREVIRRIILSPAKLTCSGRTSTLKLGADSTWPENWRELLQQQRLVRPGGKLLKLQVTN